MKETSNPPSGLQNPSDSLRKGLEDEEERKRKEQLRKALSDQSPTPQGGLRDAD